MRTLQIASWNVNSLKVRLPHVLEWLQATPVDLLGLQELKLSNEDFPLQAFETINYSAIFSGQKTYNGVAIVYNKNSMPPPSDILINLPSYADVQQRVIGATFNDIRFINAYCVNGSEIGSDKFNYKMAWFNALTQDCKSWLAQWPKLALVGDFNIAPTDTDVHDPVTWKDQILCSNQERELFQGLLNLGLHDSFRLFNQPEKLYSWWDYRQLAFQKNKGLRIDHILLSKPLASCCTRSYIDKAPRKWPKPSDHAPVITNLTL